MKLMLATGNLQEGYTNSSISRVYKHTTLITTTTIKLTPYRGRITVTEGFEAYATSIITSILNSTLNKSSGGSQMRLRLITVIIDIIPLHPSTLQNNHPLKSTQTNNNGGNKIPIESATHAATLQDSEHSETNQTNTQKESDQIKSLGRDRFPKRKGKGKGVGKVK